jgi:hypothetical protein
MYRRVGWFAFVFLVVSWHCFPQTSLADTRAAVPSPAEIDEATQLAAKAFKSEYAAAKTPAQKLELARMILSEADKSSNDLASQYALLMVAQKICVQGKHLDLAMECVARRSANFAIDLGQTQLDVLQEFATQAKTPAENLQVARYLALTYDALTKTQQYETARRCLTMGIAAAKKSRDPAVIAQWTRRETKLTAITKAYADVKEALATLEREPVDPKANLAAGQFHCFYLQDWQQGLSMLALSNEQPWQRLAEQELRSYEQQVDRIALADGWYEASQDMPSPAREALQQQAASHYEALLSSLPTLTRRRVEQRCLEIRQVASPFPKDEWVELLDMVDLQQHHIRGRVEREGLNVGTYEGWFALPVTLGEGEFELRVRAVPLQNDTGLSITLSEAGNRSRFSINNSGTRSGLARVDRNVSNTPASAPHVPTKVGQPLLVGLQIERTTDVFRLAATINNNRFFAWQGPASSLSDAEMGGDFSRFLDRICIGDGRMVLESVQLRVKSGSARLTP